MNKAISPMNLIYSKNPTYKVPRVPDIVQSTVGQLINTKLNPVTVDRIWSITDPLLNLQIRDSYRDYDRNIATEMLGRASGAGIGAAIGAGATYALSAVLATASILLLDFGTLAAASAALATSATAVQSAAPTVAAIGAGVGAAASDYTTYYATKDMLNDTLIKSFQKGGFGKSVLTTLATVGKSMDIIEGGEAIRSVIYSTINGENVIENILKSYGLHEDGRTEYDFSKIRESMDLDFGTVGNVVFDMTGEILTDPGAVSSLGKGLLGRQGGGKIFKNSGEATKVYRETSRSFKVFKEAIEKEGDDFINKVSKTIMDGDQDEFVNLITGKTKIGYKKTGEKIIEVSADGTAKVVKKEVFDEDLFKKVSSRIYNNIKNKALKNTTVKAYDTFKSIDDFDDWLTGKLFKLTNGPIALASLVNKQVPELLNFLGKNSVKMSKFADFVLGNSRKNTLLSATLDKITTGNKKQNLEYSEEFAKKYSDVFDDNDKKILLSKNIKSEYDIVKLLSDSPYDNELKVIKDKLHKYINDKLAEVAENINKSTDENELIKLFENLKDYTGLNNLLNFNPTQVKLINSFRVLRNLFDLTKNSKSLTKAQFKALQNTLSSIIDLVKQDPVNVSDFLDSYNLKGFYEFLRKNLDDESKSIITDIFKDSETKYKNFVNSKTEDILTTVNEEIEDYKVLGNIYNKLIDPDFKIVFPDEIVKLDIDKDIAKLNTELHKELTNLNKDFIKLEYIIKSFPELNDVFKEIADGIFTIRSSNAKIYRIMKSFKEMFYNKYDGTGFTLSVNDLLSSGEIIKGSKLDDILASNKDIVLKVLNSSSFYSKELKDYVNNLVPTKTTKPLFIKNIDFFRYFLHDIKDVNSLNIRYNQFRNNILRFDSSRTEIINTMRYTMDSDMIKKANDTINYQIKQGIISLEEGKKLIEFNNNFKEFMSNYFKNELSNLKNNINTTSINGKYYLKDINTIKEFSEKLYTFEQEQLILALRSATNPKSIDNVESMFKKKVDELNSKIEDLKSKPQTKKVVKEITALENQIMDIEKLVNDELQQLIGTKNYEGLFNKVIDSGNYDLDYDEVYAGVLKDTTDDIANMCNKLDNILKENIDKYQKIAKLNELFPLKRLENISSRIRYFNELNFGNKLLAEYSRLLYNFINNITTRWSNNTIDIKVFNKEFDDVYINLKTLLNSYEGIKTSELYGFTIDQNFISMDYLKGKTTIRYKDPSCDNFYNNIMTKIVQGKYKNLGDTIRKIFGNKDFLFSKIPLNSNGDIIRNMVIVPELSSKIKTLINKFKFSDPTLDPNVSAFVHKSSRYNTNINHFNRNIKDTIFIYLDTETTGPTNNGLLSASYKVLKYNEKSGNFEVIAKKNMYLSKEEFEKTGWVIDEAVDTTNGGKGQTLANLFGQTKDNTYSPTSIISEIDTIGKQYDNPVFVAHNANFDYDILKSETNNIDKLDLDYDFLDTLSLYRTLSVTDIFNNITSFKNVDVAKQNKNFNYIKVSKNAIEEQHIDPSKHYTIVEEYDLNGIVNYRLYKGTNTNVDYIIKNSEALHDADIDTEVSTVIFNDVLKNMLEGSNKRGKFNTLNDLDKSQSYFEQELIENFSDKIPTIKDYIDTILNKVHFENLEEQGGLDFLIQGLEELQDVDFNKIEDINLLNKVLDDANYVIKKAKESKSDLSILEDIEEFAGDINIFMDNFSAKRRFFYEMIMGKNLVYKQWNRNLINLDVINEYTSNSSMLILKSLLQGDVDYLIRSGNDGLAPLAKVFQNKEIRDNPVTQKLYNLFDDLDNSIAFYTNTLDEIDPEMLDSFHQMINIVERLKDNEDMTISLTQFALGYSKRYGIDFNKLINLRNRIIQQAQEVKGGRLLLQPSGKFTNELYQILSDTLLQTLKSIDNQGTTASKYIVSDKTLLTDDVEKLLRNSINGIREKLSGYKSANRLYNSDPIPFYNIRNGIKIDGFENPLRPDELVKYNSTYTLKYGSETKQSLKTKRYQNKILNNHGLYKPYNPTDNKPFIALQEETILGKMFNRIADIIGLSHDLFLKNASNYNVKYSSMYKFIYENMLKGLVDLPEGINIKSVNEFNKALEELQPLEYITDMDKLKDMYKAMFVENVFFKYNYNDISKSALKESVFKQMPYDKYGLVESSRHFLEFKKYYINNDGTYNIKAFRDYLLKHKEYSLTYWDGYKLKQLNPNSPDDTLALILSDETGAYNLISRDMFLKISKDTDSNKFINDKAVIKFYEMVDGKPQLVAQMKNDPDSVEVENLKKEFNSENKFYSITPTAAGSFINALRTFVLIPSKILSLTMSFPFLVQNAVTAFIQNKRVTGDGIIETAINFFKTGKQLMHYDDVFSHVVYNDTFIEYTKTQGISWITALERRDLIKDLKIINPNIDPDYIKYIEDLKKEFIDFDSLKEIDRILSSNAAMGEIAELQHNLEIEKINKSKLDSLKNSNPDEFYIKNPKPNDGFNSLKDEYNNLMAKEKRNTKEWRRTKELKNMINVNATRKYYELITKNKVSKKFLDVNEFLEKVARISEIKSLESKGFTEAYALSRTIDTHFLYNNKSVLEQYMEFLVPFISYPIRAAAQMNELISDYDFVNMMYLLDKFSWQDENSERSDYLTKRRAKGDLPIGNKLLQIGNPLLDTAYNINNPLEAFNNKLSPFIKPFVDLATDAEYNRINQFPVISQTNNLYNIIKERNLLESFTSDYYKQRGTVNYYLPRRNIYNKFYNSLYTRTGYSRVALNMQLTNTNNLKYRVNSILNY